jgi:hypothetical protein
MYQVWRRGAVIPAKFIATAFSIRGNSMSEVKATASKGTTKKAAVTETAKPKKAAPASAKAPAAGKASTAKPSASSAAPATAKPRKAAVSKAASPASGKAAAADKATAAKPAPKAAAKVATKAATKTATKAATKVAAAKPAGEVKKKAPATKKLIAKPSAPSPEERQRWVATAAYHRAEKRGFAPGYEVQDWLDAEAEIAELVGKA